MAGRFSDEVSRQHFSRGGAELLGRKPSENSFSVKHPCAARLCLVLGFPVLQTSLPPAKAYLQTALMGLSLRKSKNLKNPFLRCFRVPFGQD